jgi:hypothetical protein
MEWALFNLEKEGAQNNTAEGEAGEGGGASLGDVTRAEANGKSHKGRAEAQFF